MMNRAVTASPNLRYVNRLSRQNINPNSTIHYLLPYLMFFTPQSHPFMSNNLRTCFHSHTSFNHPTPTVDWIRNLSNTRTPFFKFVRKQCKLGFTKLDDALVLFNQMAQMRPLPSTSYFTQLLAAIVRLKHYTTVISLLKEMEALLIVELNVHILSVLINCYCHLNRVNFGFSIMGRILKLGYEPDCTTLTTLIRGLIGENRTGEAVKLFNGMVAKGLQPNMITCGTIINGLCKTGNTSIAIGVLEKMEESNMGANVVVYSTIIESLCKDRLVTEALELFSKGISKGVTPNLFTYNCLMHGLCSSNQWKDAMKLLKEMVSHKIKPDLKTLTIFADSLCKEGRVDEATELTEMMIERGKRPDIFTYSSLIDGYCLQSRLQEAKKVFDLMVDRGCERKARHCHLHIGSFPWNVS